MCSIAADYLVRVKGKRISSSAIGLHLVLQSSPAAGPQGLGYFVCVHIPPVVSMHVVFVAGANFASYCTCLETNEMHGALTSADPTVAPIVARSRRPTQVMADICIRRQSSIPECWQRVIRLFGEKCRVAGVLWQKCSFLECLP